MKLSIVRYVLILGLIVVSGVFFLLQNENGLVEGDVVENKPTPLEKIDTNPKYFSGVSAMVTPEHISVFTRNERQESCAVLKDTTMATISTSSSPEAGDILVVGYNNGPELNPTNAIIRRGVNLIDFLRLANQNSATSSTNFIVGSVDSYVKPIVDITLVDGSAKKIDTSDIPFFILNATGIPSIIKPFDRVDMNCEYNKGVWEAKSVTVFN